MYNSYVNDMERRPGDQISALLHAAGTVHSRLEAALAEVGLSLAKLLALQQLVDAGGSLPLGQLADRLACVKSNVTQLVDRLEADGLVARMFDPKDRRTRLASITVNGQAAFERGRQAREQAERDVLQGLSPENIAQLSDLLAKLARP
jgi:DNA-binding MarR family transcriptional regulator